MPFQPGQPKQGGRKKGTPNKRTALFEICEDLGVDPFREMLVAYKELDEPRDRIAALKEICQYVYPKLKSVEHSADQENGFVVKIIEYGSEKK